MRYSKSIGVIAMLALFSGCSDGTDSRPQAKVQQDDIWKQQTQAMERAKEVESIMSDSAKRSLEEADQQGK